MWRFLKKLEIEVPYNPAIPLLGIHTEETRIERALLFNMLSRWVITFLPRTKHLFISWLQSPSAVILEPEKIKSDTVSTSISHEVMGPEAMILVLEC